MAAPIVLQVGTRGARSLAKRRCAATRIARIAYCEEGDRWTGLPGDLARTLCAALRSREPWLLSLGLKERVAYAGLLCAAGMMRAGFAASALILPLDWVSAPEVEPADIAGQLPAGAALAFAVHPALAPPAGNAAWNVLDGPLVHVRDPDAAIGFLDAVDTCLREQGGDDSLEKVLLAWALEGRAGVFRQRLLITPDNLASWHDASPAQVESAFVQPENPSAPFVFDRLQRGPARFVWQRPEFAILAGRNLRLGDRLRSAFGAMTGAGDAFHGTADPLSGLEQYLLRRYLCQAQAGATPEWREGFVRWMLSADGSLGRVTRIESAIYLHRPDLQAHFPRQARDLGPRLREWFLRHGLAELGVSLIGAGDLGRGRVRHDGVRAASAADVHVVGYLDSVMGLGISARNLHGALNLAGVSTVATAVPMPAAPWAEPPSRERVDCRVSLLAVNGDFLHDAVRYLDDQSLRNSHRIGVWAWELPQVAPRMLRGLEHVDELWVPSGFVRDAFRPHTRKAIHVVPLPVNSAIADVPASDDRLPDAPYFFFAFDYYSAFERKNPWGLISAFMSAFPDGAGPHLVIKTLNAGAYPEYHQRILGAALRRKDIHVVDGIWPRGVVDCALRNCLAVVSLHRAEGFGLLLAEAMAHGRPTIATGYSGNLEFQHPGNSILVGYRMTRVSADCLQYEAGQAWAEPDLDEAARAMRAVFKGGRDIEALARAGAQTVRERLAPDVIGRQMKGLLEKHLRRTDGAALLLRQWRRRLGI